MMFIGALALFIGCLFFMSIIGIIYETYKTEKKNKQIQNTIDEIKNKLNSIDVIFDHSLKLTNTKTDNVAYFRVYNIYYSHEKDKYLAKAYICDKDNQIGEWEDEVAYLYTIPINNTIEDCGVWNP